MGHDPAAFNRTPGGILDPRVLPQGVPAPLNVATPKGEADYFEQYAAASPNLDQPASKTPTPESPAAAPGTLQEAAAPESDPNFQTLSDIAAIFDGADGKPASQDEFLASVQVEVGEKTYSLKDVLDGFAAQPAAAAAAQERSGYEFEYGQRENARGETHRAGMSVLAGLQNDLKALLSTTSTGPAMDQLLTDDPAAFQVEQRRLQQLQTTLDHTRAESQRVNEAEQRAKSTQHEDWMNDQHRILDKKFPEWNDAKLGPVARGEMSTYLRGMGFPDTEQATLTDARFLLVARDAARGQRVQEKGKLTLQEAKERKLAAPHVKPGARTEALGEDASGNARRMAMVQNHRQSGSIESAAAIFTEIENNGRLRTSKHQ